MVLARFARTLRGANAIEEHFQELTGVKLAGSSCSRRLRKVDYSMVQKINDVLLHPMAVEEENADAFWKGWRLMGIDGTRFTLQNTEAITERIPKAKASKVPPKGPCGAQSEQAEVCFPQINACALVELGTLIEKTFDSLKARPLPPRRKRKCPRKVRRQHGVGPSFESETNGRLT